MSSSSTRQRPAQWPARSNALVGASSALIVMSAKDAAYEQVTRAGNNIPDAKILLASYLNIRDLLAYDKVVLPLKSLDVLSAQPGQGVER